MSSALAYRPEPDRVAPQPRPGLSSSTLLAGACAVLLLAPLAFGAVQPWAIFLLEASATLLLLAWGVRQWTRRELKFTPHPLYAPMLAFGALVLVQWLAGVTAYRHVTYSLLLLYLSYGMLAFVVTQALERSSQLRLLAWAVCGCGAVLASFALLQGIAPNGKLYWIWPLEQGGLIYGPYVNHNHYAGLMEMLTPFPLVLAVSRFPHGNRKLAAAAVAALMAGTIFLSGSRGGMLAFGVQAVVLVLLLRPSRGDWKQPVALGVFLAVMIGFLVWIGGNELTRRLASIHSEARQELSGGVRLTIDRDCLRMWRERPFLGSGLGTFPVVYPRFRSFYTSFFVNQAHNDYLQLLVETGIAGFTIALWFLVLTFRRAWPKLENWTETANGTLTVAALLGCIGILVHSALDFNLQIPANAALFFVLCAIAACKPLQESQRRRRHNLILDSTPRPAES
ncbi:MAG: O-antigen ligase family protein [Terriglobales bacterium]